MILMEIIGVTAKFKIWKCNRYELYCISDSGQEVTLVSEMNVLKLTSFFSVDKIHKSSEIGL